MNPDHITRKLRRKHACGGLKGNVRGLGRAFRLNLLPEILALLICVSVTVVVVGYKGRNPLG